MKKVWKLTYSYMNKASLNNDKVLKASHTWLVSTPNKLTTEIQYAIQAVRPSTSFLNKIRQLNPTRAQDKVIS